MVDNVQYTRLLPDQNILSFNQIIIELQSELEIVLLSNSNLTVFFKIKILTCAVFAVLSQCNFL